MSDDILTMAKEMGAAVVILQILRLSDGKEFTAYAFATDATSEDGERFALDKSEGMGVGLHSFTVMTE